MDRTAPVQDRQTVPDPSHEPTLSVEDAGRIIGISRSTAYAAVNRGEIPVIRIGRLLRVPTAALRQLLSMSTEVGS